MLPVFIKEQSNLSIVFRAPDYEEPDLIEAIIGAQMYLVMIARRGRIQSYICC